MTDQLADLQAKIHDDDSALLLKWRHHAGLDADTLELYHGYERARAAAHQAANSAQSKVEKLRDDDLMPAAGKARLVREAIEEGRNGGWKAQQALQVNLAVLDAHLAVVAMPRIDKDREALARDEIRTRLSGSPNLVSELLNLAQQDSDMAAILANGTFAESFMRGQGTDVRRAKETAETLRRVAAASAVQSADPVRRAAAQAREDLGDLQGSMVNTDYIARHALEDARTAAWSAGVSVDGDERS